MPTPTKPFKVLTTEKKSHRTKAELKMREEGEKALGTDFKIKERKEVKQNKVAHKEFQRIIKLLENIDKNDAIYEAVINRYCLLQAECFDFELKKEKFYNDMSKLEDEYNQDEMSLSEYYNLINDMQKNIVNLDKQIQSKRKMLLDIEKENVMTIASALRCIPKKDNKEADNPLLKVLRGEA